MGDQKEPVYGEEITASAGNDDDLDEEGKKDSAVRMAVTMTMAVLLSAMA